MSQKPSTGAQSGPYPHTSSSVDLTEGPIEKPECRRHTVAGHAARVCSEWVWELRKGAEMLRQLHPEPLTKQAMIRPKVS